MIKAQQELDRKESYDYLHSIIKPGSEIKTILRHVSSSGMTRYISLFTVVEKELINITFHAARVMGEKVTDYRGNWTIKVGGCGMDMCFSLVYDLGRYLYRDGFIPAQAGKSIGRNGTNANELDKDGGYALRYTNI